MKFSASHHSTSGSSAAMTDEMSPLPNASYIPRMVSAFSCDMGPPAKRRLGRADLRAYFIPKSRRGQSLPSGASFDATKAKPSRLSPLQLIKEVLAELRDLRRDDGAAVGLEGVLLKIVLMIVLRRVELCERRDFGDDGRVPDVRRRQLGDCLLGGLALRGAVVEDG